MLSAGIETDVIINALEQKGIARSLAEPNLVALSGDTGYASGPHLHFCVQMNKDMQLVSVPFQFADDSGAFTPQQGQMLGGR